MAAALEESLTNLAEKQRKTVAMRDRLIRGLSNISRSRLNGDPERRLPGNVNFSFDDVDGESLLMMLDEKGIAASSGSACMAGSLDPSHVLLAIGCSYELAKGSLRLTIDENNTLDEIDTIIKEVTLAVETLRSLC